MTVFGIVSVVVSLLLMGAHLWRLGSLPAGIIVAGVSLLLLIRRPWAARFIQILLIVSALEWVRTIVQIAIERMDEGRPWLRMALILSIVLIWTLFSAAAVRNKNPGSVPKTQ